MEEDKLIPHLFRTEYSKITAVLCAVFGFEHIEIAEDIASDTFLSASEIWSLKGLPDNPVAWLYTVAKNKARNVLKHQDIFNKKVSRQLNYTTASTEEPEIDLSVENIRDSQLQMIFAICHPAILAEAQIGLALRILCGFGIGEIADAFLTNRETISKRLQRAKDRLRAEKIKIEPPGKTDIGPRLETVLRTLYLLFNEGYYSVSHNSMLRKDLCFEAMRLTSLLVENEWTDLPAVNALFSLMCFQSSRLEARIDESGEAVLYDDQDTSRWDKELITRGEHFLNRASRGDRISKYHLEAGIAYWHTIRDNTKEKWENILQLYNHLLPLEYSPIIALNRTYALSRANGKAEALAAAKKLNLEGNHLYHVLLSDLYTDIDKAVAIAHLQTAMTLARSAADKTILSKKMTHLASSE
jgi:predicted RNA polymerase sigma factor